MNTEEESNREECRPWWPNCAEQANEDILVIDKMIEGILASLGQATPVKRWLAASLDKTIRMQLEAPTDFWLTFC
jgi:hypothetical protein